MLPSAGAELYFLEDELAAELPQLIKVLLQILSLREVFERLLEFNRGIAVPLAGQVKAHQLEPAFDVVWLDAAGKYLGEHLARDTAGGNAHIPNEGPGPAAEAFKLRVERRDLRDALHNGQRACRT